MAAVLPEGKQSFTDAAGVPLVGGKLYTYDAGTSNPRPTYSDAAGTVPNTNPVILDARGEATVFWSGSYKVLLKDAADVTIWTVDGMATPEAAGSAAGILTLLASSLANQGAKLVTFIQRMTGAVARWVEDKLAETISVKDFGAKGDGITDDSAAVLLAFNALKNAGGGKLRFPTGDYRFNIDVSGVNPKMTWIGDGAVTFRPYLAAPTFDAIIYANNSTGFGTGYGINITFRNIDFTGRFKTDVDPQYGRVGACVKLLSSWATFYDCSFQYGINAGFYGYYGQYNEFWSCAFGANVSGSATAGCLLESNTDAEACNENTFMRCKFNTNKNGLVIKGGLNNRIIGNNFQNTIAGGLGALVLLGDATSFGTSQNHIAGNYFEANSRDVHLGIAPGQTFTGNIFLPGTIYSTHCYDLRFVGNYSYGGTPVVTFNHPAPNTDTAALTWIGNNFDPDVSGVIHAGPSRFDISCAGTRQKREDNMLITTGQLGTLGVPLVAGRQYGFKSAIARTVSTNLFKITQEAFASSTSRHSAFELVVQAVNDESASSQYGYCSRIERFHVFITNNTTGSPQVFINTLSGGVDTGISPAFAAIGVMSLTATVVGAEITFKLSYPGAGSSPSSLATITAAYEIRYTGGNPVSFTRL